MFVVNANIIIRVLWGIVETLMDPNTKAKISLVSDPTSKEITDWIHPSQLLRKYGGTADSPKAYWPPVFPPGPIVDNLKNNHMTVEEFKEELLKNPQLIPSPELASFVREARKGKSKKGQFPRKEFILPTRVERRDSFNGIISEAKNTSLKEPEKSTIESKGGISVINKKTEIKASSNNNLLIEKEKPPKPEPTTKAVEVNKEPDKDSLSPQIDHSSKIEIIEHKLEESPSELVKKAEEQNENADVIGKKGPEGTTCPTKNNEPQINEKDIEVAIEKKLEDDLVMECKKPKAQVNDKVDDTPGCRCIVL